MRSPLARAIVLIVVLLSLNWKTLRDWAEEVPLLGASHAEVRDAFLESRTIYGFRPSRAWKTERRYRDLGRVIDALESHSDPDGAVVVVVAPAAQLIVNERAFVHYRSKYSLYPRAVRIVDAAGLSEALEGAQAVAFLETEPVKIDGQEAPLPVAERSTVVPLSTQGR